MICTVYSKPVQKLRGEYNFREILYPYHKEILGTLKALSAVVVAAFAVKLQWAFCVAPKCRSLSLCGWNTLLKRIFSFSAKVPLAVVLRLDLFFRANPKNL